MLFDDRLARDLQDGIFKVNSRQTWSCCGTFQESDRKPWNLSFARFCLVFVTLITSKYIDQKILLGDPTLAHENKNTLCLLAMKVSSLQEFTNGRLFHFVYCRQVLMGFNILIVLLNKDRKSTRLNSSHLARSRMPSSA